MDLNLAGRSVIVTGGGSNIGRAIALAFAREGAQVALAEIDEAQGRKVAAEAERLGARAIVVGTDVTDREQVSAMVRTVQAEFGHVDVLVNNVGWTLDRLFLEKPIEEMQREVQLNLWGMVHCTRAVLDGMIARRSGAVVSIGSDAGRIGEFREGVYAACKAGVIALTKSLAREVGRHGIRLNVVCPGLTLPASEEDVGERSMWVAAEMKFLAEPETRERIDRTYPLRRVGRPEDVAPPSSFASDAAAFVTTDPQRERRIHDDLTANSISPVPYGEKARGASRPAVWIPKRDSWDRALPGRRDRNNGMNRIKGITLDSFPDYIEKRFGKGEVAAFAAALSPEAGKVIREGPVKSTWYSRAVYFEILAGFAQRYGGDDPSKLVRDLSAFAAERDLKSIYRFFLKFGYPGFVLGQSAVLWKSYFEAACWRSPGKDRMVVGSRTTWYLPARPRFRRQDDGRPSRLQAPGGDCLRFPEVAWG
jgi:2-hydroxycyclohexanecarboxyl-CoA dehydrogenase